MKWKSEREPCRRNGKDRGNEEAPEFFTTDEIIKFLNKFCMIGMCALEMKCKPFFVKKRFGIQAKSVNPYNSSFEMLTQISKD